MLKKNKIKIKLNGKLISIDKGTNLSLLLKKFTASVYEKVIRLS